MVRSRHQQGTADDHGLPPAATARSLETAGGRGPQLSPARRTVDVVEQEPKRRTMRITCRCGTPGCPSVVTLRATAEHHAEGPCPTCGETWTLKSGALVSKHGIVVSEAHCGADLS